MRILVACTALVTLAACTNWHAVEVTPAEYLRDNTPDVVRLTRSDSSHIRLRAPMLRGDTIVGLTGQGSPRGTARQVMVPLSSVHGMAVPRFSARSKNIFQEISRKSHESGLFRWTPSS